MNVRVPISDLVDPVATWNPSARPETTFRYIDLSAVDQAEKKITAADDVLGRDAPSRARQLIHYGDVLISTVRPNLNGVAAVTEEFDGATASTGFCVLRPRATKLTSQYLLQWVRSPKFVEAMVREATGASYPAVSDKIIKASQIPLPPLDEQRRIAAILDKADELCRKRKRTLDLLDRLTQSIFMEIFGDPVENPYAFPEMLLGEVGRLDRGVSKHRPRNDPILLNGEHPLIQTGDVSNSGGYIRSFKSTYSDEGLRQSKKWPSGTLCITIAANIAQTGILTFPACFPDSVVGFSHPQKAMAEFIRVWLSFLQKTIEITAPSVAQKNINLHILRDLKVAMPPASLIEEFAQRLTSVRGIESLSRNVVSQNDRLFSSLQSRAFSGQL